MEQNRRKLLIHVITYLIVNIAVIVLNFVLSPNYYWFLWVTLGWGTALICHGLIYYYDQKSFKF